MLRSLTSEFKSKNPGVHFHLYVKDDKQLESRGGKKGSLEV